MTTTEAIAQDLDRMGADDSPALRAHVTDVQYETYEIEARIGLSSPSGIKVKAYTALRSPMSKAAAAFLLNAAGCLCTVVLHKTGAPEWAQLGGLLLPWAIMASMGLIGRERVPGFARSSSADSPVTPTPPRPAPTPARRASQGLPPRQDACPCPASEHGHTPGAVWD